jgi:mono/diheme cytochrome c family protein
MKSLRHISVFLVACASGAVAAPDYPAAVNADKPAAYWRFGGDKPTYPPTPRGAAPKATEGPRQAVFPMFSKDNAAVSISEKHFLVVDDPGDKSPLDFTNGDSITLEAWVELHHIGDGENRYIFGKGRTGNPKFAGNNQNYALRLRGKQGGGAPSFLFRSMHNDSVASDWHRWTADEVIIPYTGWRHIAVIYTFGKPDSVRAYIDGKATMGSWDMGGPTDSAPVVDNDQVWIGSALYGGPNSTFSGKIDEVAIYRTALSKAAIGKHFKRIGPLPKPKKPAKAPVASTPTPSAKLGPIATPPNDAVRVEIHEDVSNSKGWPTTLKPASESFNVAAFGLVELPARYTKRGVRDDRSRVFIVRAASRVKLPKGEHQLVARAADGARLYIDGNLVSSVPFSKKGTNAHDKVPKVAPLPAKGMEPVAPGQREILSTFTSPGAEHTVVYDYIVGRNGTRHDLCELVLAIGNDNGFKVLSPATDIPFTPDRWTQYKRDQRVAMADIESARRKAVDGELAKYWDMRHAKAKAMLAKRSIGVPQSAGLIAVANPIDHFIGLKVETAARQAVDEVDGISFTRDIKPLLQESCLKCHDAKKQKGELRLDSREAMLKGGESGEPAILVGNADKSVLMQHIRSKDEDLVMPPKGDPLDAAQIDLLARWITAGAKWSSAEELAASVPVTQKLLRERQLQPSPPIDDLAFLRRVSLDTVGVIPSEAEITQYLADPGGFRRSMAIDRLLADDRWADHWVSYWQDVLAENPGMLKPKLNNTGPFRWWMHESFVDNKPMDRFVTELVAQEGARHYGGPAGFSLATENDVPAAAKAHVIGTAFLGVEMKCARCHDAPYHDVKQEQLFNLAALFDGKPQKVPKSSTVPADKLVNGRVKVTLKAGASVNPVWPFAELADPGEVPEGVLSDKAGPRQRLAALITGPQNERFPQVLVNRVWKRYMGRGLVEPAHDWQAGDPSHPELLKWLGHELATNNYDLKHVARLILNSNAYQRQVYAGPDANQALFLGPVRRRMTAEQLVDSLHVAAGRHLESEELTMDLEAFRPANVFLNFGQPQRAWEFTSLSNERDRPALAMPKAQSIVDVLKAFGWRETRQNPVTDRETDPNVLQPASLANGTLGRRITRLSDDSPMTQLALQDQPLDELIGAAFLRYLSRPPTADEAAIYRALLTPGFASRVVPDAKRPKIEKDPAALHVSWSNHLSPEATVLKQELEKEVRRGGEPSVALQPDWRERMEDMLWALVNSPETMFVP